MAFVAVAFLIYIYSCCIPVLLVFYTFATLVVCFLLFALRGNTGASYEQSSFILYSLVDYDVLVSCLFALRPELCFCLVVQVVSI